MFDENMCTVVLTHLSFQPFEGLLWALILYVAVFRLTAFIQSRRMQEKQHEETTLSQLVRREGTFGIPGG